MARPRKELPALTAHVLQPRVMPVDWLTVNIRVMRPDGAAPGPPTPFVGKSGKFGGLTYRQTQGATRVWSRIDTLYGTDGQAVAEVASGARSALLFAENEIQVKAENRTFYDGRWTDTFNRLLKGEGWKYTSISQLDLAADGVGFLEPFTRYVREEIETSCRAKLRFGKPQNGNVDELILGSKQAGKYARCYYKREELAVSGKTYINDYWKANGVGEDVRMDRLEVSMKGGEIRRYFGGDNANEWGEVCGTLDERDPRFLDALVDPHQRVTMYHSAMRKMIAFREAGPGRARDKRPLIKWDYSLLTGAEVVPVQRAPRLNDIGLNAVKVCIKINYLCSRADGGGQYLSIVQQQCAAFGLEGWYFERQPAWDAEYRKFIEARGLTAATLFASVRLTLGD